MTHFLGRSDEAQIAVKPLRSLSASAPADSPEQAAAPFWASPEGDDGRGSPPPPQSRIRFGGAAAQAPCNAVDGGGALQSPPRTALDYNRRFRFSGVPAFPDPKLVVAGAAPLLQPVWSLRHGAVSSFRFYHPDAVNRVGEAERRELDFALLQQVVGPDGVAFLQQGAHLHLPVAWTTLLAQRDRLNFLNGAAEQRGMLRSRVLLEIEGLETGVLESRLAEVAHYIRPFFRLVLASCGTRPLRAGALRGCGLSGLIVDAERLPVLPGQVIQTVARARSQAAVVVVHGLAEGLASESDLIAAGASHLSWRSLQGQARGGGDPRAADARELTRIAGLIQAEQKEKH